MPPIERKSGLPVSDDLSWSRIVPCIGPGLVALLRSGVSNLLCSSLFFNRNSRSALASCLWTRLSIIEHTSACDMRVFSSSSVRVAYAVTSSPACRKGTDLMLFFAASFVLFLVVFVFGPGMPFSHSMCGRRVVVSAVAPMAEPCLGPLQAVCWVSRCL